MRLVLILPFFLELFSARSAARARNGKPGPNSSDRRAPAQHARPESESHVVPRTPPVARHYYNWQCPHIDSIMARFRHHHKKSTRSIASEDPWKVDTPFGPPRISHFPGGGIRRIRNTLSKLTPSARAERELLKQKNRYKIPLTHRNMDTFVTEQEFSAACYPDQHSNELHVSAWLERLAY